MQVYPFTHHQGSRLLAADFSFFADFAGEVNRGGLESAPIVQGALLSLTTDYSTCMRHIGVAGATSTLLSENNLALSPKIHDQSQPLISS